MLNKKEALKQYHQSPWSDYQTGNEANHIAVRATTEEKYCREEA